VSASSSFFNGGALSAVRASIGTATKTWSRTTRLKRRRWISLPQLLLKDLKDRGMLEDTLFIWNHRVRARTRYAGHIDSPGRRPSPGCLYLLPCGVRAVKSGFSYGASDEVGYFASEQPVTIYDLHATILHLLGIDHEKLTFYHNGIKRRLTDGARQ
jgi:hypothetical protein